jgi:hypothetical protein
MALVSKTRDQQTIPHEPGEWMTFRPLSGTALAEAREVVVQSARDMIAGMNPETVRLGIEQARQAPDRQRSVWDLYDHATLLRHAIVEWSYGPPEEIDVEDLDARTSKWAVGYVLDANGLLETEEERKNG